jgi:hypothetical protein
LAAAWAAAKCAPCYAVGAHYDLVSELARQYTGTSNVFDDRYRLLSTEIRRY